jgi:predicted dehydrogenase
MAGISMISAWSCTARPAALRWETARWKNDDTLRLYLDQGGVPTVAQPRVSTHGGHADAISEFVQRLRSGNWAGCTGREGLKRSQIIEAAYTSARPKAAKCAWRNPALSSAVRAACAPLCASSLSHSTTNRKKPSD